MLIDVSKYRDEIAELYRKYLNEEFTGGTVFGIVRKSELQAVASARCYHGHWYLRGCVVKPEHRGNGFQKKLIKERLDFLAGKTDNVRVSIYPWNTHSIDNVLTSGFEYEKDKKLANGKVVHVYRYEF